MRAFFDGDARDMDSSLLKIVLMRLLLDCLTLVITPSSASKPLPSCEQTRTDMCADMHMDMRVDKRVAFVSWISSRSSSSSAPNVRGLLHVFAVARPHACGQHGLGDRAIEPAHCRGGGGGA